MKEERQRYRHPSREHIPVEHNISRVAKGFPWRAVGARIWLMMLKGEERTTEGGIVLPDVAGSRGKDKELTTGIVVAHGPGEVVATGQYMSPEHDYECTVGDVVFVEPNSGIIVNDEDNEYRVITPHDIVGIGRRDVGINTRNKLLQRVGQTMARYQRAPADALVGTVPRPGAPLTGRPNFEMEIGEAQEEQRRAEGKATKSTFPRDSKLPAVVKE